MIGNMDQDCGESEQMNRGEYRKYSKHKCKGCDHPAWCPSRNVNAKRACVKCRKNDTKRRKHIDMELDGD